MRHDHARRLLTFFFYVFALSACTSTDGDTGTTNGPQLTAGTSGAAGAMAQANAGSGGAGSGVPGGTGGAGGQPVAGAASGAGGMIVAGAGGTTGGMGPTAGTGDDGGMNEDPDAGVMMPPVDEGEGDGKDVVTIGDSWMSIFTNGGGIEGALDRAGKSYRHYAVAGTTLGGSIPGQYTRAIGAGPIKTVIMTGGGNDIMFSNACATKAGCEAAVQMIADELDALWSMMAEDGVKDVIYIQYSKNAGTAPQDTRPDMAPIPAVCLTGRIRCHSIDTTPFVGPTDTVDGIHPTLAACDLIAEEVLSTMESAGARR